MIYMDAAATTAVNQEILQTIWPLLSHDFGNPSSRHELGASAARALDYARGTAADALGVRGSDVVFTSGGTEANNLALKGLALAAPRGKHLVISQIEHSSIHRAAEDLERLHGFDVSVVGVDASGVVDPADVQRVLRADTTLVSVMAANNEVGTVQPISRIAAVAKDAGALMHTDAVQAAAWLDVPQLAAQVDALSISGHKLGGLKGAGVLMVRARHELVSQISGGGQERGRRSGTENVAGAVATALALKNAVVATAEDDGTAQRFAEYLRDGVVRGVGERALPTGDPHQRVPGIVSFCFPGTSGEAVLLELERRGVLCSSGSACHADSEEPSPVLLAMGFSPDVALTSVRLSFSRGVKEAEITQTVRAVVAAVNAVAGT
ncbi:cysteine desulfurase family protein [Zhihengliuella flava]|uniref:cysteine desulfurase n=1 Tax=Zhihengliuella flava TaxID=1285193 RepID=A0A931GDM3_9MICC|nr:cysteine desulfurase family protein [Zhihengliuella flava]MBG6083598.1 cysteine desulfurase [Zhihengliuella flava]